MLPNGIGSTVIFTVEPTPLRRPVVAPREVVETLDARTIGPTLCRGPNNRRIPGTLRVGNGSELAQISRSGGHRWGRLPGADGSLSPHRAVSAYRGGRRASSAYSDSGIGTGTSM